MAFMTCGGRVHHFRLRERAPVRAAPTPLYVFINALGTDHRIWDDLLDALPHDVPALVYDQRGQGLTELGQGAFDCSGASADLNLLLGGLGAGAVVLCGLSLGGLVAMRFALAYPERVRGLCLCATAPRIGTRELWDERMRLVRASGLAALAPSVLERWFSPEFSARRPEVVRGYRVLLERASPAGYLAAVELLRDTDSSAEVGAISVPTLVVGGECDVATPPDQQRRLAQSISGAELRVLPGAGHLLCIEQPEALARALVEFSRGKGIV